ncbi:siderophore ABC transporter substrate-binding protein [Pelistega europaea]|uniref:Siderophore ABC transporter substrate-binding protein n=1 Tax=Pelistega europaea TaxID=106147 RepID=A0A7Y4P599_9BURK|nr:siderophore ABC transporter substrate-binding protein [Pelistega europaea]NOL50296.1 siderophore ABC transporter substrate-binding protein [Pelistega europaea]
MHYSALLKSIFFIIVTVGCVSQTFGQLHDSNSETFFIEKHNNQNEITIHTPRGNVVIPRHPKRVAVYDWAALDTLHKLHIPIGATTEKVHVDYLEDAFKDKLKVGTLFQPNYEALHAYQPDLIITGGPGAVAYPELEKIAPTIDLTIDNYDIRGSGIQQIALLANIFDKQKEAQSLIQKINQQFEKAQQLVKGKGNGLVISITGNKITAFSPNSRLGSWIHKDVGIPPVDTTLKTTGHGQPISFEYIRDKNPDWLFVLDRTAALGDRGPAAMTVLDNALIHQTTAWRKKQIIIMPTANYIAAGGSEQLERAIQQILEKFSSVEVNTSL